MNDRRGSKPLVRCAMCSSDLIYPLRCAPNGAQRVIDRRCPECEYCDRVITSRFAAELEALADALDGGLELDFELPPRHQ
jgi:hypothetical protein